MHHDTEITPSPSGTYAVQANPWEARASQWIYQPRVVECAFARVIWSPLDRMWSLDSATWRSRSVVCLLLRKFPGGQSQGSIEVVIDCEQETAWLNGAACALRALETRLNALISAQPKA